jgi:hypothetical protein
MNVTFVFGGGEMEHPAGYENPREEFAWLLARLDVAYGVMRIEGLRKVAKLLQVHPELRDEIEDLEPVADSLAKRIERQAASYQKFQEQGAY